MAQVNSKNACSHILCVSIVSACPSVVRRLGRVFMKPVVDSTSNFCICRRVDLTCGVKKHVDNQNCDFGLNFLVLLVEFSCFAGHWAFQASCPSHVWIFHNLWCCAHMSIIIYSGLVVCICMGAYVATCREKLGMTYSCTLADWFLRMFQCDSTYSPQCIPDASRNLHVHWKGMKEKDKGPNSVVHHWRKISFQKAQAV